MNQDDSQIKDAGQKAEPSACPGVLRHSAAHFVAFIFFLVALASTLWFIATNPDMVVIFQNLTGHWQSGRGSLELATILITAGCFTGIGIIGWFYLETHEVYLPRIVIVALGFLFGLGLCGFVLECLAIAGILMRTSIALAMIVLLAFLAVIAHWRSRQMPETGMGGHSDSHDALLRRRLARRAYHDSLVHPVGLCQRTYACTVLLMIALISLCLFWHAVLYPAVYWDSLILYLGYARMTFLDGGFPEKVTGQVGIGLGANYPHLYEVLGAGICTIKGGWSEIPQRLMVPVAGLASTLIVYHTLLRLIRHVSWALTLTLLYRSIPLGIIYDQYASSYSLAILFTAGFLYLSLMYIDTGLKGYFRLATLLIALSMHLNYLMGILWVPWLVMVWMAHWKRDRGMPYGSQLPSRPARLEFLKSPVPRTTEQTEAPWSVHAGLNPFRDFVLSAEFWRMMLIALLVGSTWMARNWYVTGNPVYAFFNGWFGGIRVNPDVMRAAAEEWALNGAGIGQWGESMADRILALWPFLTGAYIRDGELQHWVNSFRLSPVFLGFAVPGLFVFLASVLTRPWHKPVKQAPCQSGESDRFWVSVVEWRFGLVVLVLMLGLLFFHLKMAPYYLYQICPIIVTLVIMASFCIKYLKLAPWNWLAGWVILVVGLMPGLAMAMMGFKIFGPVRTGNAVFQDPKELYVFRNPLPDRSTFLNWRYGDDQLMWEYINSNLPGIKLLTHENRHLVFDPWIKLVHLDDWEMQQLWRIPDPAERVKRLIRRHAIRHYLYVPNEDSCATNVLMGTDEWPEIGLAKLIHQEGSNRLYRLQWPPQPVVADISSE